MTAAQPVGPALALSVLLHAAAAFGASLIALPRALPGGAERPASWAGDTFDVDELIERSDPSPGIAPAPGGADHLAEPASNNASTTGPAHQARPRPHREHRTRKGSSTSESGIRTASTPERGGAMGNAPAGGQMGSTPAGPASLAKAFTKAVTAATHSDPLWDELPLGEVGSVSVRVTVDAEGRISTSALEDEKLVPAPLKRLVERTLGLLRAGRFALGRSESGAGSETLRIEVKLAAGQPAEDYDDPRHTTSLGFDAPAGNQAGRAWFVHASGRRFEARVSVVE